MQTWIDRELERIHNSKEADVQTLYRKSLLLEPRENQMPRVVSTLPPVGEESAPPSPDKASQKIEVPKPSLAKEASGSSKTDLFGWTNMFKTPSSSSS